MRLRLEPLAYGSPSPMLADKGARRPNHVAQTRAWVASGYRKRGYTPRWHKALSSYGVLSEGLAGAAPQEKTPGRAGRAKRGWRREERGNRTLPTPVARPTLLRRPNPRNAHLPKLKQHRCCATSPYPPTPSIPYPTPMPTRTPPTTRRACEGRDLAPQGESRGGLPLFLGRRAAGACAPSYQKTSEGGWAGPTNVAMPTQVSRWPLPLLPATCFPLSDSRHSSPRPSAHVRPAPYQIRFVPIFRPFQRPPDGPSALHPAHAWQLRLVSLCRLVRRASIPSWIPFPQARAAGKDAQHNSRQVNCRSTKASKGSLAELPAGSRGRFTRHGPSCMLGPIPDSHERRDTECATA